MRSGARRVRKWAISSGAPVSTRSPVRTMASGEGSSRLRAATARSRADAVSTIPIRSVPGGVMWVSVMWAINIEISGLQTGAPAKDEDALLGEQVGQAAAGIERIRLTVAVQRDAAVDADPDLVAQRDKVADRAEMNVGGLVPGVGETMRERHPAGQQKSEADAPEPEIRKRHDRPPADPHELLDDPARPVRRLQGLAQHDDIERLGRIGFEIPVGVALNDRQTVADTGVDARLAQLDAAPVDALLPCQIAQQGPIAAADVE